MDGLLTYPIPGPDNTTIDRIFICKTYALEKVLKHLGITVSEFVSDGYFSPESNAGDFTEIVMLFMYHSAVYACKKDGKPVDFTEADCYDWVDNTGGFAGGLYAEFSKIAFQNLGFREVENAEPQPEKKSKVKTSNGKKS